MDTKNTKNIIKSLIVTQQEIKNPERNKKGYGYKYTSLDKIIDDTQSILNKNGLTITSSLRISDGKQMLTTSLFHESGESITSDFLLESAGISKANNLQQIGAAITYARRYILSALLNIASEDDDDAQSLNTQPTRNSVNTATSQDLTQPTKKQNDVPPCPTCKGEMWDNRAKKASGTFDNKTMDFTCKNKNCYTEGAGYSRRSGLFLQEIKQKPVIPENYGEITSEDYPM